MINKEPRIDAIAVRRSDNPDELIDVTWIGKIVNINGKRVTILRRLENGTVEERFLLEKTLFCVCDTELELAKIHKLHQDAASRLKNLRDIIAADVEALMGV